MGCDIHMRAEVRIDGEWQLLGRVFESDTDNGPDVPATRQELEMLSDGELLEGLAWQGRSLEQIEADRAERVKAAGVRGLSDARPFDPARDDYHRDFRNALSAPAQQALAAFYASLCADRAAISEIRERWRTLCATLPRDDDEWGLPDGYTYDEHVRPAERRAADVRRDAVTLDAGLRAHIIDVAAAYRPYGDDDLLSLSWDRGEREPHLVPEPYGGRNYDLFAMLADVRNGGYRGEPRRIVPLDEPRGVPDDASDEGCAFIESYGCDGHSHSYFTLAELKAVDWGQAVNRWGVLSEGEFLRFRAGGEPRSWCGSSYGDGIRMFTVEGYDEWVRRGRPYLPDAKGRSWLDAEVFLDAPLVAALLSDEVPRRERDDDPLRGGGALQGEEAPADAVWGLRGVRGDATGQIVAEAERVSVVPEIKPNVRAEWVVSWRDAAGSFVTRTLPQLTRVASDRGVGDDDIRLVFFFDN